MKSLEKDGIKDGFKQKERDLENLLKQLENSQEIQAIEALKLQKTLNSMLLVLNFHLFQISTKILSFNML